MRESVKSLFGKKATENRDKIFLYFGEKAYSYREAGELVNRLAKGFRSLGVGKGDKVCTLLYNSAEHVWTWLALAQIGAIWVPLNTSLKTDDLIYTINDSEAKVLILQESLLERYHGAKSGLMHLEHVVYLGDRGQIPQGMLDFNSLMEVEGFFEDVPVYLSDVMSIVYTGGTTGLPKGVILPHFSYICAGQRIVQRCGMRSEDTDLKVTPLNHIAAQHHVIAILLLNTYIAFAPKFSASQFWDQTRRYNITVSSTMGPIFEILLKQEKKANDRDNPVRLLTSVELSYVSKEKLEEFKERFGIETVQEVFGMTEFGCLMTANPLERIKWGSIGTPSDDLEMDIFDENDFPLPTGKEGEIVVRPKVPFCGMLGYYKKPEETLKAFRNLWFHTGDMGYKDEDGYFYIAGRQSHKIRRKGENISAYEIEQTINKHPKVEESVAVGIPSEWGSEEEVKVFIKPKIRERIDPLEIVLWCSDRLAHFKIPRYVEFVEEFPRTEAIQRIEREKLKKRGIGNAWDREAAGVILPR